ncbi:MAG: 2-octaprenyl-3-methyl-6-methoxy-1,4-benzoquinol hydroxylase [Porticoccaceae bacterium]|nr:2-octaprenyl-3-methyl-6-methoxy-1,4-benzoquinol hydroxylase [Porticoccaceae bacterium]
MHTLDFDVVIIGGGMTGLAMAGQLGGLGLKIAIVEKQLPTAYCASQPFDLRVSALSPQSVEILEKIGAWKGIGGMRFCPYSEMRVWEMRGFGDVTFEAANIGENYLGYIVENRVVQLALLECLSSMREIDIFSPVTCLAFYREGSDMLVTLEDRRVLKCRLLIGADGADSEVRDSFGISIRSDAYHQSCLVTSVTTDYPQQEITWQRFTSSGPQAFLPLPGHHASLVWYDERSEIENLVKLDSLQLEKKIHERFPGELGSVRVNSKGSYNLSKQHAKHYVQDGLALVGDAVHTINPLAGQGANLGFQDTQCLSQSISKALEHGTDWSSYRFLVEYQRQRRWTNELMLRAMDAFYYGFSNEYKLLKWTRNVALAAAKKPLINRNVMRYAMGI